MFFFSPSGDYVTVSIMVTSGNLSCTLRNSLLFKNHHTVQYLKNLEVLNNMGIFTS